MIKTYRRVILGINMAVLVLLMALSLLAGNIVAQRTFDQLMFKSLQTLAERTEWTEGLDESTLYAGRVFFGEINLQALLDTTIYAVEIDAAETIRSTYCLAGEGTIEKTIIETVISEAEEKPGGRYESYFYYFTDCPQGTILLVLDGASGLRSDFVRKITLAGCVVAVPMLLFMLLICWIISGIVLRPAKDALERQNHFLADAGHELKTPLTAIVVNTAVLENEIGSNSSLTCIREETERMGRLLQRMLEAAQFRNRPARPIREPVDLTELVGRAAQPFEQMWEDRRITWDWNVEEGVSCMGDEDHIRQIITILMDNTRKYTNEGGRVEVRLTRKGAHAVLEIGNTGPGIAQKDIHKVFDRFYRCDQSRTYDGGYGLGLAIAKELTAEQCGKLRVRSIPGEWTVFTLLL